jgi:hypothetical protein
MEAEDEGTVLRGLSLEGEFGDGDDGSRGS